MKATELLQKQHRDIESLLERLRAAGQGDERAIRQELAANLVAHTVIEEEHFYPAVREALPDQILEAIEEHGLADVELARLLAAKVGDETFDAKASVLSEVIIAHIQREEREVFKTADRELGDEHQSQLGEQMAQQFRHVIETGFHKFLHKALEQEVPRTPGRVPAAKKTARRAPAAKKKTTRRAAASQARATPPRTPTKRAAVKRGASAQARKGKPTTRGARGAAGTTRKSA
jgi:hemerythrin-like domain-containing protein